MLDSPQVSFLYAPNLEKWSYMYIYFFLSESNLITEGDNSEDFFIHTLPSSPPLDLKCETTFDSLNLTWTFPFTGMFEQSNDVSYYYFKYELIESKLKKSTLSSNNFWLGNYVKGEKMTALSRLKYKWIEILI